MKWRSPGRSGFAELRDASTGRSGPITVSWCPGGPPPRVAYAISKRVGTAVVRNRTRRRLNEAARRTLVLEGGIYLVRAAPMASSMDFTALRAHLARAIEVAVQRQLARDVLKTSPLKVGELATLSEVGEQRAQKQAEP